MAIDRKLATWGMAGLALLTLAPATRLGAQSARVIAAPGIGTGRPLGQVLGRPAPVLASPPPPLDQRVAALEARIADQQRQIDLLKREVGAPVPGYQRAFITLAGFRTLPPTDAILYYARH